MLLRLLTHTLGLMFPLLAALIVTMRLVGGTQAPHPALLGFANCFSPDMLQCWYGITPGITSTAEAQRTITMLGYRFGASNQDSSTYLAPDNSDWCDVRVSHYGGGTVRGLFLSCREAQIRIGDMMALTGSPERMDVDYVFAMLRNPERGMAYRVQTWTTPYAYIDNIELSLPYVLSNHPHPWHGFISKQSYCRYEPDGAGC